MPLPVAEIKKRSRVSVARRKTIVPPKAVVKKDVRSDEEDDEPPSDGLEDCSSSSSVESETSDTSLTNFRIQQKAREEAAASASTR